MAFEAAQTASPGAEGPAARAENRQQRKLWQNQTGDPNRSVFRSGPLESAPIATGQWKKAEEFVSAQRKS